MKIAVRYNKEYIEKKVIQFFKKQLLDAGHQVIMISEDNNFTDYLSIQDFRDNETGFDILIVLDPNELKNLDNEAGWVIWTFNLLLQQGHFESPALKKVSCSRYKNLEIELLAFKNTDEILILQTISLPVNLKLGVGIPSIRQILQTCLPYLIRNLNILSIKGNILYDQAVPKRTETTPIRFSFKDKICFQCKKLSQRLDELLHFYHWNIGLVEMDIFRSRNEGFKNVSWLSADNKEHTYADPFLLERDGKKYVFFEDIGLQAYKGHISVSEFDNGKWSDPVAIIKEEYTLSFPSIFEYKGDVYCMPEAREANNTVLYKAIEFPYFWEKDKVIFNDFSIVDPQVFFHDNRYWMFFSPANYGRWNQLFLYYADDPTGQWHPHSLNPVKTDMRLSRNAGSIFSYQGKLFRPSMDNSEIYGNKVIMNEITCLSVSEFDEQEIFSISPHDYPFRSDKTHTISSSMNFLVLDSCVKKRTYTSGSFLRRKFSQIVSKLIKRS